MFNWQQLVKDKKVDVLFQPVKITDRWKEYVEELYDGEDVTDDSDYISTMEEVVNEFIGSPGQNSTVL